MKALELLRNWPSPEPAFVVTVRLRNQRDAHRTLGLRIR
jgi:hypothetical protein